MADLFVVEELFAYLISQGVAQPPDQPPSTSLPGVWRRPRTGAPEPRDGENVTITLVATRIAPPSTLSDVLEETYVDVIVRARTEQPAMVTHRRIRELIVPIGAQGGRRQLWMMNQLLVEASWIWRGEQPLPMPEDSKTFDRVASYCFECRRKALIGEPYAS